MIIFAYKKKYTILKLLSFIPSIIFISIFFLLPKFNNNLILLVFLFIGFALIICAQISKSKEFSEAKSIVASWELNPKIIKLLKQSKYFNFLVYQNHHYGWEIDSYSNHVTLLLEYMNHSVKNHKLLKLALKQYYLSYNSKIESEDFKKFKLNLEEDNLEHIFTYSDRQAGLGNFE